MPYVVTQPQGSRGIYDTWPECLAAVSGVPGARYQKVKSREEAQAILDGTGVVLPPGLYAFTDGNALGGVGVVIVRVGEQSNEPQVIHEIATSAGQVFNAVGIPGLESDREVDDALGRLHNILAEMAALYAALREVSVRVEITIVHDYKGVSAFMEGRWQAKDPIVESVVSACHDLAAEKELQLRFLHQHGHMSTWAGRHDLARFNGRADALARQGGPTRDPDRTLPTGR